MTLEQVISRRLQLRVMCLRPSCAEVTTLERSFFAARYGVDATLAELQHRLFCAGCGSKSIAVLGVVDER